MERRVSRERTKWMTRNGCRLLTKKDMDSLVPSTRSRRVGRKINYFQEKLDTQFVDYPGLTRFERTRKGDDVRPRTVKKHAAAVRAARLFGSFTKRLFYFSCNR